MSFRRYFALLPFVFFFSFHPYAQTYTISGIVKDADNKQPIPFCSMLIMGTRQGTATNMQGKFSLIIPDSLKNAKLIATYCGYATDTLLLKRTIYFYTIYLQRSQGMLNEVIVTGVTRATLIRENPLPIESISPKQIAQATADNVIDAIAENAPGFEAVKTGPNVSKPFINGLGYNRVLTLYDGMRVETQQWGDEHGVPIDDYIIERAEVIKGPASLMYGSDAIAGVLSLFPAIPHDTDKTLHGRILSEYQSNNGLIGNGVQLTYAGPHWAYAIRGSERIAKNYTDPVDGRVYNTGFKTENASGFIGYTGSKGYSRLNYTFYNDRQGIPDGSRDSLTRKFTYQVNETQGENDIQPQVDNIKNRPVVPGSILNSYSIPALSQRIQDYRLYSDNFYNFGQSDIKFFLGGEQNIRREYDHPTDINQAGMYVFLNTLDYGVRYDAPVFLNIESSIGVNGMYQTNKSLNATDFPIPDYSLFDVGAYVYGKWKHNRWTIAGGIRYDHRNENGDEMYIKPNPSTGFYEQVTLSDSGGGIKQFPAFNLQFMGVTGSMGATYQLSNNLSIKANVARGYRAPNITEIASNGLDPGAHIVYLGNFNFHPEFSLQEDVGLSGAFQSVSFDFGVFNNNIQGFIYEAQEVDNNGNPVVIVPGNKTFQFQQTSAQLYGINAAFNIHPERIHGVHFNNVFSCVYGFNRDPLYTRAGVNGEYLPFIPPPALTSGLSYDIHTDEKTVSLITLKTDVEYNAAQNRYLGLYNTELPTAAYTLVNAGIHADINYSRHYVMQIELNVNNLFNSAYQSHLSRLQYFEYYAQSSNGHIGIYNMGRNICLKIILPF